MDEFSRDFELFCHPLSDAVPAMTIFHGENWNCHGIIGPLDVQLTEACPEAV